MRLDIDWTTKHSVNRNVFEKQTLAATVPVANFLGMTFPLFWIDLGWRSASALR